MKSISNYSTLAKICIYISLFNLLSFGCDTLPGKDEPSCSGGAMWEVMTEVDSLDYSIGYLIKENEYFVFDESNDTTGLLAIQVKIISKEISSSNQKKTSHISFFSSAYASPGPTFKSNDNIKSISVTTTSQFKELDAGENISSLFEVVPYYSNEMFQIDDIIKNQKDFALIDGHLESAFWIVMNENEEMPKDIIIDITLENGKNFEKTINLN